MKLLFSIIWVVILVVGLLFVHRWWILIWCWLWGVAFFVWCVYAYADDNLE